ncbi:MAG: ATP-binding protein [Mycobacteriales bacterium]
MRRVLVLVSTAVTSMVVLSFMIPLALLVRQAARDQAVNAAERQAGTLAPVLTVTTRQSDIARALASTAAPDRLGVHLPDGAVVGTARAPADLLANVSRYRRSVGRDIPGGYVYLQPMVLGSQQANSSVTGVAVVEAYVPAADLRRGVATAWLLMTALALGLIAGSVLIADRLGSRAVRACRDLARAARRLGGGDLQTRVRPAGPPELREAGEAFNLMADKMVTLLANERELVADLSHRLRTPLTALRLESEGLDGAPSARRVQESIGRLEHELDGIIQAAREPLVSSTPAPAQCDAVEVVRERAEFWSALAEDQGREHLVELPDRAIAVPMARAELAAMLDTLLGNVFRHTPEGTAYAVRLERSVSAATLVVEDAGAGIADPEAALRRGSSGSGSTGLGLDIVRRSAAATGGGVRILRSPMGGAAVLVMLGLPAAGRGTGVSRRAARRPGRQGGRRRPARR